MLAAIYHTDYRIQLLKEELQESYLIIWKNLPCGI